MKDILKELAEMLPDTYDACTDDETLSIRYACTPYNMYADIYYDGDPVRCAEGTTVLLQFIESQGWLWEIGITTKRDGMKCYYCRCAVPLNAAHFSYGNCPTIAEAVVKATLEVARRMK